MSATGTGRESPAHAFTPAWARHAIWYQIFPDRFCNGDPANDPPHTRSWTSEWFTPAEWERPHADAFYSYVFKRFYGGDLQGILNKLPYLKELGVNALYLNPVFQSISLHKYDATNYLHVDEHLGTPGEYESVVATEDLNDPKTWKWTASDRKLLELIRAAHSNGLRIILDGVFNHVGTLHPAFQDVRRNGHRSSYADWFDVTSWEPLEWHGWAGHKDLPVFRKSDQGLASPAVIAHIFNVTRRWMDPDGDGDPSDGIDGWRLDVPNEIALPFWVEWRKHVRSINPEAYIVGEIWKQADGWLDGRSFDAVMNYPFAQAAVDWICNRAHKCTVSQIDSRLRELRRAYPAEVTAVMQNLLDSHDTARMSSMALNPDREYERGHRAQEHPGYNHAKPGRMEFARQRLAALLQMTYVGAPMIYYGDEAGLWGADDPSNRKPMLWKDLEPYENPEENHVLEKHLRDYKALIALRNQHPALRSDNFETLLVHDAADLWAFRRWDSHETMIVILNASEYVRDAKIGLPPELEGPWTVVWGGDANAVHIRRGQLDVRVPALGGVVLHR